MKDLPEHEAFKALENRLSNYTEQPDDDLWKKIGAGLPPRNPAWAPWLNRFAATLAVAALGWALSYNSNQSTAERAVAITQPKSATNSVDLASGARENKSDQKKMELHAAESPTSRPEDIAATKPANENLTSIDDLETSSSNATVPKSGTGPASIVRQAQPGSKIVGNSNQKTTSADNVPVDPNTHSVTQSPTDTDPGSTSGSSKQGLSENAYSNKRNMSPSTPSGGPASDPNHPSNLSFDHKAEAIDTKSSPLVTRVFPSESYAGQPSSLQNSSSSADQKKINPADENASRIPLSTSNSSHKQTAADSAQQETPLAKVSKVDSSASTLEKSPYNPPKKKRPAFAFYALFSPTLSFQSVSPTARDGVVIQKFNNPGMFSKDRVGLAFEAGVQGRLSKKFEYFAGLSVYHQSQTLRYTYQSNGNAVIENGPDDLSYTVKPTGYDRSVSYNMLNLGAQAGVLYTVKEHRLSHKVGLALQYQKGLTHALTGDLYDNASSSYVNYQLLYRAEIALDDHFTFIVQPSVTRTWLVNETLQAPFTLKQYRPGISLGLSYRLWR